MYHVDISNSQDNLFNVRSKDYEFIIDLKGRGITPPEALLASLGTCVGVYLRKYAEGVKLTLPELAISVDADLSKETPICFRKIYVNVGLVIFYVPRHVGKRIKPEYLDIARY
ncbi:MAG: OsmC family protein [Candidatus Omnitrophica bacterium]|nr:OsmC family protein [Candidatus Omnitrophota bacterium]